MAPTAHGRRKRVRLVAKTAALGTALGIVSVGVLTVTHSVAFASQKTFALAALVFGFALVGWSGSVLAGRGIENMQRHLDTGSNWTEKKSRQAMVVIGSLGFGGMVGTIVATTLLGGG